MTNEQVNAALKWLKGSWQASDNRSEAANAAAVIEAMAAVGVRQEAEIERLRGLMRGWRSYAWKDGEYIDDVQAYFDEHLGGADEPKGFIEVNLYPEPQK